MSVQINIDLKLVWNKKRVRNPLFRKELNHLIIGLEVKLITTKLKTLYLSLEALCIYAEQAIVVISIVLVGVMAITSRHDGSVDSPGDFHQTLVNLLFLWNTVIHDLNKVVISADNVLHCGGLSKCSLKIFTKQCLLQCSRQAAA